MIAVYVMKFENDFSSEPFSISTAFAPVLLDAFR